MSSRVPFFPDAGARPSRGDVLRPERVPSSPCNTISLLFLGPAMRGTVMRPVSKKSSVPAPPWPSPRDKFSVTVTAVGSRDEVPLLPVRDGPALSRSPMEPGRVLRGEKPRRTCTFCPQEHPQVGLLGSSPFRPSVALSPLRSRHGFGRHFLRSLPVVTSCGHCPPSNTPRGTAPQLPSVGRAPVILIFQIYLITLF